jgi:hypothetical protein
MLVPRLSASPSPKILSPTSVQSAAYNEEQSIDRYNMINIFFMIRKLLYSRRCIQGFFGSTIVT